MSDLRTAAQQALQAMLNFPGDISDEMFAAIAALKAALKAALAQQDERCPNCASLEAQNDELDRKLSELERTDLSRCPQCGGIADNGHDRQLPPNPYWCTRCVANARDDWK